VNGALLTFRRRGCRVIATWLTPKTPRWYFRAVVDLKVRDFLPLLDGVTQVGGCGDRPPSLGLAIEPGPRWPPFVPGNVFIPLHGESTLDGLVYATAEIEERRGCSSGPKTVAVRLFDAHLDSRDPTYDGVYWEMDESERRELLRAHTRALYRGLRPGDAFPWAGVDATVVRIVSIPGKRAPWEVDGGWVELTLPGEALSAPPDYAPPEETGPPL
jgi:hypothetical protein